MDDLQKLLDAATPGPWVVKFRKDQSAYICMGGTRPGDAHKQFDLLDCDSESDLADVRLLGLAKALACQVIAARKLVEALRFYADAENWTCEDGDWEMAEAISDTATDDELAALNIISAIEADEGKAARAAFAEWEAAR
ncbi:hypothetical protein [Paracoccus homiensis]|uniref:Uncharacterized protein n=1 Tax=Paracoccus homiensis TaxID=364199 RepID=A0A1I0IZL1_9RHOB|nr:hypothetical protein [Paracoccus homiensis]SEU02630.1 hypothetical protein SAMN04489858_12027 [Paracoccus homiensis]